MHKTVLTIIAMLAAVAGANAQNQRRAVITGGGDGDRGKCTIEVVVDGAAEVEIRGDNATLRDLAGQPPQFRRFQCNSVMPPNPANFRFSGVDGRGSQTLIRDPRNGGAAVVRIEDPQSGSEGYTFDLTWGGGNDRGPGNDPRGQYPQPRAQDPGRSGDRGPGGDQRPQYPQPGAQDPGRNNDRGDRNRDGRYEERDRISPRFTADQAVRVCQDAVRAQAADRFHARDIDFRRTTIDDKPGRNDWVIGTLNVRRGYNRVETYRFSCSVDFDSGRVRSVDIQPMRGWGL
jgi:hypothetical protein